MRSVALFSIIIMIFASVSQVYASGERQFSPEQKAYEEILEFILKVRYRTEKVSFYAWTENIKILIKSPSQNGDKYLAYLAFFSLDAHLSEEFACAVDRRLQNSETFIGYLKSYKDRFDQENPCEKFNNRQKNASKILVCRSRQDLDRFVAGWIAELESPNEHPEVDCSEFFQ